MSSVQRDGPRDVTLALEGGGALGAFTWGVLERLLDCDRLSPRVVSGTSAGAMNGAMLVQGLVKGGPAAARELLQTLWERVSIAAGSVPGVTGNWLPTMANPLGPMLEAVRKAGSAFTAASTFSINPLRGVLSDLLDPACFADPAAPTLVVAATRVRTGEAHLFWRGDVTIDALLASACLPMLFPTVTIGGEAYWDGGYSSNPPVRPLIEAGCPSDVIIVRTMPGERLGTPLGASAVKDRLSEITFGTPLRAELHGLALAQSSLAAMSSLPPTLARLRSARLHMIRPAEDDVQSLSSALSPSWALISDLRRRGQRAAERWLDESLPDLGRRSTFTLDVVPQPAPKPRPGPLRRFFQGVANAS